MSKPTKYGRCKHTKLARSKEGVCHRWFDTWRCATNAKGFTRCCPLLPNSKRKAPAA